MPPKVYLVDPLLCTRCRQCMSIFAFVIDQRSISRILERFGLRSWWCGRGRHEQSRSVEIAIVGLS